MLDCAGTVKLPLFVNILDCHAESASSMPLTVREPWGTLILPPAEMFRPFTFRVVSVLI
jgi:hypothetical protein